jgi:hypothetical protein
MALAHAETRQFSSSEEQFLPSHFSRTVGVGSNPTSDTSVAGVAFLCLISIPVGHVCKSYPTSDTSVACLGMSRDE